MENIRCFAERQEFNIKPLTFLVGESSTGKSTTLGCLQILGNLLDSGKDRITPCLDFNVDPYSMGSFKDIVTRKRPVGQNFKLGFEFDGSSIKEYIVTLTEKEQGAEPTVEQITIKFEDGEIHFRQDKTQRTNRQEQTVVDTHKTIISKNIFHVNLLIDSNQVSIISVLDIDSLLFHHLGGVFKTGNTTPEETALREFVEDKNKDLIKLFSHFPKFFSFAPIRSRPKRTYDPVMEFGSPEGSDIPMLLMRMESSKSNEWRKLQEQLAKFGNASGLFNKIEIKRHGKSMSDPFQIQVKGRGARLNIMDVGYGVSQTLPILVRIFSSNKLFFLLQQPEVHLHPRAQAELVSLFVSVIREKKHSFIIETHSDYMVDRVRIEIKRKNISPEDVSLIYLEPKGSHVKVHNIEFDEESNLIGAPGSYGDFLLEETDRLLWNSEN